MATALGEGAIGVIRLSGPDALKILTTLFRTPAGRKAAAFTPWRMRYGRIVDPASDDPADEVLAVFFPAPNSYTCEDVVEIHGHGGPIALQRLLELVLRQGARLAEPGEFTLRALLNGRLDLAQAEAVADIISARSAAALRSALAGLSGRLSARVRMIRSDLLVTQAYLTARVDFPDDDIPEQDVTPGLLRASEAVAELIAEGETGRVLRYGVRTAIVGRPNAGKSSLLNRLVGTDRAIVTPIPGTTRDTIEETVMIRGVPFVLVDTAGIGEASDHIERIGVERSRSAIAAADLAVLVVDVSRKVEREDREIAASLGEKPALLVLNKIDLIPAPAGSPGRRGPVPSEPISENGRLARRSPTTAAIARVDRLRRTHVAQLHVEPQGIVGTSALTGAGIDDLEAELLRLALAGKALPSDAPLVTNPRHLAALRDAAGHLAAAVHAHQSGLPADFVRLDAGAALTALGTITGETVGEDLLDEIFRRFCIGK